MKLKTSFSELTPLKKDVTRFAPVWGLYLVGLLMVLFNSFADCAYNRRITLLPEIISAFGVVNLIYAGICAQVLFGDLFNTRMCYSLHALPQRRESWLLSHFTAGVLFSLVPNLITSLIVMSLLPDPASLMLYVLLAMELQFLFYFGLAILSITVTGNRFAMLLVYGGLNFVSMLAWWVLDTVYLPLLQGVELDMAPFTQVCPTVRLFEFIFMEFRSEDIYNNHYQYRETVYYLERLTDGWGYLATMGVLGLVLTGAATLLYRLRHLESAGDFVAFPKLKIPMLVVMTVCVGGAAAFMGDIVFGDSMMLWLIVGIVVGYFGGMMLLERRVKVFRVKSLVGFAVLAAVLVCSYLLTSADVFGIAHWVPKANQVESVTIANYNSDRYNMIDGYFGNRVAVTLEEPEQIDEIIRAHEDIIDRMDNLRNEVHHVVLLYKLESGRTVKREYWAPANGTNYEIISKYFYTPQSILGYKDWDTFVGGMQLLRSGENEVPPLYWEDVLLALRADCEKGFIRLLGMASEEGAGYLALQSGNNWRDLAILPQAEQVRALLSKPEIVLGYEDWDAFLKGLDYVSVDGMGSGPNGMEEVFALMEAVRADCEQGRISLLDDGKMEKYYLHFKSGDQYRRLSIPSSAEETVAYIQEHFR